MASTGVTARESTAFRRGVADGRTLTAKEREDMLKKFLPEGPTGSSSGRHNQSNRRTRGLLRSFLHMLCYAAISFVFSVFVRFRRSYRHVRTKIASILYHHHRTPEFIQRDVRQLERLPQHLSVILDFNENDEEQGGAGLEGLLNNVCEIAAWTASAGIPFLSVYERSGKCPVGTSPKPQRHWLQSARLCIGPEDSF